MANGLLKDFKGYNIYVFVSVKLSIEKSYDGYIVSHVIVAGGPQYCTQ